MAAVKSQKIEEVFPSIELLSRNETSIPCSAEGCSRVFQNSSCLRMHLIKTHGVAKNSEEKMLYIRGQNKSQVQKHFYCPIKFCVRGQGTKRPFSRLSQLKQHYMTVHAEKKNVCAKCGKGFGLADACRRHESKCGQLFKCSCGCPYTTIEALLTHAKRHMHSLPDGYRSKKNSIPQVPNTVTVCVVKPSTTLDSSTETPNSLGQKADGCQKRPKLWRILPKPVTNGPTVTNEDTPSLPSKHLITKAVQTQIPCTGHSIHTQTPRKLASKDLACNSHTQTSSSYPMEHHFNYSNSKENFDAGFSQASVGTQVAMLANQSSICPEDSFLTELTCLDRGSGRQQLILNQNLPQTNQVQQLPSISSFVSGGEGADVQLLPASGGSVPVDPLCFNTETQTNLTCTDLALNDFRLLSNMQTQTCTLDSVPLEDNETQTLISVLGIDSSNSTDSGTQTQNLLDDLFGPQDIELTESQTQTWFSDYNVGTPVLENSSQDFVDKTIDDFVDIHTQTSLMMSDFSELVDDITFANSQTQTLPTDLSCTSLLSSSGVQTDFHWLQMSHPREEVKSEAVAYTSSQTQTIQP